MSLGLLLLAFAAAVNPCRTRLGLPAAKSAVPLGALVALAAGAALASLGDPLLGALDVSPESFRLAAGAVLLIEGTRDVVLPRPATEPVLPGLGAALVPIAFPLLLRPGPVVLALAAGGDGIAWKGIAALAVALALVVIAGAVPTDTRGESLLEGGSRLLAALEVTAGIALGLDAITDV